MQSYIVSGLILFAMITQSIIFYIERQDLINRLMAKDYTEYRQAANKDAKVTNVENVIKKNFKEHLKTRKE